MQPLCQKIFIFCLAILQNFGKHPSGFYQQHGWLSVIALLFLILLHFCTKLQSVMCILLQTYTIWIKQFQEKVTSFIDLLPFVVTLAII